MTGLERKELIVIAGPNGSGKSTLAAQLNIPEENFINADLYEKMLYSHIKDKTERETKALFAVQRSISNRLNAGGAFCMETVFATEKIPDAFIKAKRNGYKTILHYIATDKPELNVERVAIRVSQGGHDVPKDKILKRYHKSIVILPELVAFFDEVIVYDNSGLRIRPFYIKDANGVKVIGKIPVWANGLKHQI